MHCFIDYEKAFNTVEHFAIFEALRKTNISETYINILQNIYSQATARIHLDKSVSDEFPIHRGVRQADQLSPELFTARMEEVFEKADISEGSMSMEKTLLTSDKTHTLETPQKKKYQGFPTRIEHLCFLYF